VSGWYRNSWSAVAFGYGMNVIGLVGAERGHYDQN
jgi:hypothetical protein